MKDLVDVPKKVLDEIKIEPITSMDEVILRALHPPVEKHTKQAKQ
jgi:ATP-dependent Lon protease